MTSLSTQSQQPEASQQSVSVRSQPTTGASQVAPQGHPPSLPELGGRVSQIPSTTTPNCDVDSTPRSLDVHDKSPDGLSALQCGPAAPTSKNSRTAGALYHLQSGDALTDSIAVNITASNSTVPAHVTNKTSEVTVSLPGPVYQEFTGLNNLLHVNEELSKEAASLEQGAKDAELSHSTSTKQKTSSKQGRARKSLKMKQLREEACGSAPDSSREGEGRALSSPSTDTMVSSSAINQEKVDSGIGTTSHEAACHSEVGDTVDMVSDSVAKPVRRMPQRKKRKVQHEASMEDSNEHKSLSKSQAKDTMSSSAKLPTKRGKSSGRTQLPKSQYKTPSVVLSSNDDRGLSDLEVGKECLLLQSCNSSDLKKNGPAARPRGRRAKSKVISSDRVADGKDTNTAKVESVSKHQATLKGSTKGKKRKGRNAPLSSQNAINVTMQCDTVEILEVRSPERFMQAEDMVMVTLRKEENSAVIQDATPPVRQSKPSVSSESDVNYRRPDTDSEADWISSSEEDGETKIAEDNTTASEVKSSSDIEGKESECGPMDVDEQRNSTDDTDLVGDSTANKAAQATNTRQRVHKDVEVEETHPVSNVAKTVEVSSFIYDVDTDPDSEWTSSEEEGEVPGKKAVGSSSVALPNSSKDMSSHSDQLPVGEASAEGGLGERVNSTGATPTHTTQSSGSSDDSDVDVDVEVPDCEPESLQVQAASQAHLCTEVKVGASESSVHSVLQASGSATGGLRSDAALSSQVLMEETQDLDAVPETQFVHDIHGEFCSHAAVIYIYLHIRSCRFQFNLWFYL